MRISIVFFVLVSFLFSYTPIKIDDVEGETALRSSRTPMRDRVLIDSVGDIRAIMGPGRNIVVSQNAEAIAVIYGYPTGDPNNAMTVKVAYSTDGGASWATYGPFSGDCRRCYPVVDGASDFNISPGHLYFSWQENGTKFMIEENIPSAPSFSVPVTLSNIAWMTDIAVAPDDPLNLIVTAWRYLAGGSRWIYCWISTDGGGSWTDTIPMIHGDLGYLSRGTNGYVVYTYHDYYLLTPTDSILYPYYIESTDRGYTWSAGTPVPGVPVNTGSQFWWHEFDCLVINNEPWFVHTDIGSPGGGPYVMKGTGSPGNWTWSIWDAGVIGYDSTYYGGELWYCVPSLYPSISFDPVSNTVLVTYASNIYIGDGSVYNGAHIQGIYTNDGGNTWTISDPLSAPNNEGWANWGVNETAHHLVRVGNWSRVYSVWVNEIELCLYFESEWLTPWGDPVAIESDDDSHCLNGFFVTPSVSRNQCAAEFAVHDAGNVSLIFYDALGRHVEDVLIRPLNKGQYTININTSYLAAGIYFVVLKTETGQQVEKIVVAK
jgi:hypothetical protein